MTPRLPFATFNFTEWDERAPAVFAALTPQSFLVVRPEHLEDARAALKSSGLSDAVYLVEACHHPTGTRVLMTDAPYKGRAARLIGEVPPRAHRAGTRLYWLRLGEEGEPLSAPISVPASSFTTGGHATSVQPASIVRDIRAAYAERSKLSEAVHAALAGAGYDPVIVVNSKDEAAAAAAYIREFEGNNEAVVAYAGRLYGLPAFVTDGPHLGTVATFVGWLEEEDGMALLLAGKHFVHARPHEFRLLDGREDYNYSAKELRLLMGREDFEGVVPARCSSCGATLNWARSGKPLRGAGAWDCPGCGAHNTYDEAASSGEPFPFPAFGPSIFTVRTAETAALADTCGDPGDKPGAWRSRPAEGMKVATVAAIDDRRDTALPAETYAVGMFMVVPEDFPDMCELVITQETTCYAKDRDRVRSAAPSYTIEGAVMLSRDDFDAYLRAGQVRQLTHEAFRRRHRRDGQPTRPHVTFAGGEDAVRRVCVHQPEESARKTQLAFALRAARRLGWRVLVAYGHLNDDQLQNLLDTAHAFDPATTVGVATPEAVALPHWHSNQVTLATSVALSASRRGNHAAGPRAFDLIVTDESYGGPDYAYRNLADPFKHALLLAAWTSRERPADGCPEVESVGNLTIFEPWETRAPGNTAHDGMSVIARIKPEALTANPANPRRWRSLTDYPLPLSGLDRDGFEELLPAAYLEEPLRTHCEFDFGYLSTDMKNAWPSWGDSPYTELPPRGETKVARVRKIFPCEGEAAPAINMLLEYHPADVGMYVLVPDSFADECDVEVTLYGYFATPDHESAGLRFRVWPSPTVREAEAAYGKALGANLGLHEIAYTRVRGGS